jgi:hypothetical protein
MEESGYCGEMKLTVGLIRTGVIDILMSTKMKKVYFYLFYCFYSILQKKDTEKVEGATSLTTVLLTSIIFSLYFLSYVWFNLKIYYPKIEIVSVIVLCLFVWFLNRRYFIKKKNADQAIQLNENKNELLCKSLGVLLAVGQIALFIASGIIASKHVWQW